MTKPDRERKKRPCAACGKPVGNATIVFGGRHGDAPCCADCFRRDEEETDAMIDARSLSTSPVSERKP